MFNKTRSLLRYLPSNSHLKELNRGGNNAGSSPHWLLDDVEGLWHFVQQSGFFAQFKEGLGWREEGGSITLDT